jgi:hypothetical protein
MINKVLYPPRHRPLSSAICMILLVGIRDSSTYVLNSSPLPLPFAIASQHLSCGPWRSYIAANGHASCKAAVGKQIQAMKHSLPAACKPHNRPPVNAVHASICHCCPCCRCSCRETQRSKLMLISPVIPYRALLMCTRCIIGSSISSVPRSGRRQSRSTDVPRYQHSSGRNDVGRARGIWLICYLLYSMRCMMSSHDWKIQECHRVRRA